MNFFNSLSQISKNRGNFKKWEENQKDEAAKREELYNRRKYSDEEIARAKALGENIIDVIDIMDNHSESVAENVETATQPIVGLSPLLGLGGGFAATYPTIYKPNVKRLKEYKKQFFESEDFKKFEEAYNESQRQKGKSSWWSVSQIVQSKKRIEKEIYDTDLKAQALKLYNKYKKETAFFKRGNIIGGITMVAATLASFIGLNIYAAKLQVDSSKIARYQARESLKDPKAFVTYTPEQIAKAKEEIDKNPELRKQKKKEKLNTGFFKSIINLFKDRKAYKNFVKNDKDESKIVTRELSADEIKAAKQDQEVIQRTVRIINNEAEKYSQNMEVAAEVLINGTPFLGAAIGGVIAWVLNKFGVVEKFVDKNVEKNGSEETKKLYSSLKKGKESGISVHTKWNQFMNSFMDDLTHKENNVNTAGKSTKEIKEINRALKKEPKDIVKYAKRFIVSAFANPKGKGWIISGVGTVITGFAGALIGLKLQKSAARAGRYTAKRELEKDPRNFIGYTEDDYNEVKDVKSDKKSTSKVMEVITFLPKTIKQYFEYEKFRKNEYKENQLLQEQLMKQEITEEQLKDAKNLQRKLFNTFEKVDDNSQTYSESMEAAIDIAKPFVMYGGILAIFSPLFILGALAYKGKISGAKILNKFAGFMSKSSERIKSKWFKKYLNNVSKNVSTKVQNTEVKSKPIGTFTKGIDLSKDPIIQVLKKVFANMKSEINNIAKMEPKKQQEELWKLKNKLVKVVTMYNPEYAGKFGKIYDRLMLDGNPQTLADTLTVLTSPTALKTIGKERYNNVYNLLSSISERIFADKKALMGTYEEQKAAREALYNLIKESSQSINIAELKGMAEKLKDIPSLKGFIDEREVNKLIQSLESLQKEGTFPEYYVRDLLSYENISIAITSAEKLQQKLKEIPELIEKNPELKSLLDELKAANKFPIDEKSKELLLRMKLISPETNEIDYNTAKQILKQIKSEAEQIKISDLMRTKLTNPKAILGKMKASIEQMSDDKFAERMEQLNLSRLNMDRKTMLEIIPKIEKIIENLPKEEMENIFNTILKEMSEHPDEFMKFVTEGNMASIFMTPGLKKALTAAGISWAAFTLVMTYAVESWLADIQLKAGRLGVMKAIEGLDDYRYYANIEKDESVSHAPQITSEPASKQFTSQNLLERYRA